MPDDNALKKEEPAEDVIKVVPLPPGRFDDQARPSGNEIRFRNGGMSIREFLKDRIRQE